MRIGVFGGSFDPIHYGHLLLAEQCREQAQLDKILFIPAAVSPLKESGPVASDRQRIEMVSLAIAGHSSFEISTIEIDRGETSFTVDTLAELKSSEYADDQLFLLIGQDSLATFDRWKEPQKICDLAMLLVVARPNRGNEAVDLKALEPFATDEQLDQIQSFAFQSRLIDISSTDIRQRVAAGRSIRFLTPRSVEKYMETAKLYQA